MDTSLLAIYSVLLALISSVLLLLNLKSAKKDRKDFGYNPRTLVIVPCKGLDITLKENLRSIAAQKYQNYDAICVVDNEKEVALKIIRQTGLKYIIVDPKIGMGSGKVKAIASALKKFPSYQTYVIVDSDVCADSNWLSTLLQPLKNKDIGISTAYPFFDPISGFWSKVKSVWAMVGESMMESEFTRFGWGGSIAFRNGLIGKEDFKRFKDAISDDVTITKISRSKGLKVGYIGSDKLKVNVNDDAASFFEWSNRQTAFSFLLGRDKTFYPALILYSLQGLVILSAIALGYLESLYYLLLLLPLVANIIRNYIRSRRKYLELIPITFILPFIYFVNIIIASKTKQVKWRGKEYNLVE